MTKNEIIDKVLKEQRIVKYLPYFKQAMLAAMDEWARVQSIEFIKWAVDNHSVEFEGFSLGHNYEKRTIFVNHEEIIIEQLYDLFIDKK